MSEEKKYTKTKEICEGIKELSVEDLDNVTGGVTDEDEEPIVWELWNVNKSSGRAHIPHEFL